MTTTTDWVDERNVQFDDSVIFGNCWSSDGFDLLRQESFIDGHWWAVWPEDGKWSLYGGPEGLLSYRQFDSELEAKNAAARGRDSAHEILAKIRDEYHEYEMALSRRDNGTVAQRIAFDAVRDIVANYFD